MRTSTRPQAIRLLALTSIVLAIGAGPAYAGRGGGHRGGGGGHHGGGGAVRHHAAVAHHAVHRAAAPHRAAPARHMAAAARPMVRRTAPSHPAAVSHPGVFARANGPRAVAPRVARNNVVANPTVVRNAPAFSRNLTYNLGGNTTYSSGYNGYQYGGRWGNRFPPIVSPSYYGGNTGYAYGHGRGGGYGYATNGSLRVNPNYVMVFLPDVGWVLVPIQLVRGY